MQPLLLFFTATVNYSLSICLYETNFPYKGGHSTEHSIFKTCVQHRKDHFGLFLNTNTYIIEAKILIYQIDCSQLLSF